MSLLHCLVVVVPDLNKMVGDTAEPNEQSKQQAAAATVIALDL